MPSNLYHSDRGEHDTRLINNFFPPSPSSRKSHHPRSESENQFLSAIKESVMIPNTTNTAAAASAPMTTLTGTTIRHVQHPQQQQQQPETSPFGDDGNNHLLAFSSPSSTIASSRTPTTRLAEPLPPSVSTWSHTSPPSAFHQRTYSKTGSDTSEVLGQATSESAGLVGRERVRFDRNVMNG